MELILIPLALGLISFLIPKNSIRIMGLLAGLIPAGVALVHACSFKGGEVNLFGPWLDFGYGLTFHFSYDGLGLAMILLTNLLVPVILLSNFNSPVAESKVFHAMLFFMQCGLLGVFTAADGILFYVFWEFTLIPIFLIILWFGSGTNKGLLKFFVYTLFGSLGMLLSFIALGAQAESFDYADLIAVQLDSQLAFWVAMGFLIAFAIKIPLFPFHTWQPDTYSGAPMAGTMLLSALMLKMALFGMIKWMIPLTWEGLDEYGYLIIILAVIGILYGGIIAIKQNDIKKIFAFSSISHLGLIVAGIVLFTRDALVGSTIQLINHSLLSIAVFMVAEILESRLKTRNIREMGGIAKLAPKFGFWFAVIAFTAVSIPFTAGFIGEFIILKEITGFNFYVGIVSATTLVFGAVYMLRSYQVSMFGSPTLTAFEDLKWNEWLTFALLVGAMVVFGFYPELITNLVGPSIDSILQTLK